MKKNTKKILTVALLSFALTSCSVTNSPNQLTTDATGGQNTSLIESSGFVEPATILSVEGGDFNPEERTIFMLVDHNTTSVSLSGKVKVSEGSKWKLYRGETEIATKVAATADGELVDGNNMFFIVVSANDGLEENTYELNVYRSFYVTISYTHKNKTIGTDNAPTGYEWTLRNISIPGYTFGHWEYNGEVVEKIIPWDEVIITAVADANSYAVSLDPNGGEVPSPSVGVQYDHEYSLPAPERRGYEFLGWFDGDSPFPSSGTWEIDSGKSLIARWRVCVYTITYELGGGANSADNPSSYTVEDAVSLASPTRAGYTFLGWFDTQGGEIAAIERGTIGDIALIAHWNEGNSYAVSLDPNGGEVPSPSVGVQYDHEYSLPAPERRGYEFLGWFDGDSPFPSSGTWEIDSGKSLIARWRVCVYTITYELGGGANSADNPSSYTVEDAVSLASPTRAGYTFLGWSDSMGQSISEIKKGSVGNIAITANWSADLHVLTVSSEATLKGSAGIVSGNGYTDEKITVRATPTDNYVFWGWYHESLWVSGESTYTFTMPAEDYSLVARFAEKTAAEIERGIIPTLANDGKSLTYGLYPTTHINDSSLIASLDALSAPEESGWYLYDGKYYAKETARGSSRPAATYTFNDGVICRVNSSYWFRVEPIQWKVLFSEGDDYFLTSEYLLDVQPYDDSSSNYKESSIRAWLNEEFFNRAFYYEKSHIQTTAVDNSLASVNPTAPTYTYFPYTCETTNDKVFLLSRAETKNSEYGFEDDNDRICKVTDYTLAKGSSKNSKYGSCDWWTRSPNDENVAWAVHYDGATNYGPTVSANNYGVRPALHLVLN